MPDVTFDLNTYRETVRPVAIDDLDFASFARKPVPEDLLRCVRYMHDIESHTVCYLRDLLLTHGHRDPRITTFLTMWNYEEYWHGVALGRVLQAHAEPADYQRVAVMRSRLGWRNRLAPFLSALGSTIIGTDFVALHMSWGAVNEWSTRAGYERLAALANNPVLTELLSRISRQESRHIAFYATEARRRLAASARARRLTRYALRRLWAPVGSGVAPAPETQHVMATLIGGNDGLEAARRIDRHIDTLPGLNGLHLVTSARSALLP